jgi:hypothetical protein
MSAMATTGRDDRELYRAIRIMCTAAAMLPPEHGTIAARLIDGAEGLLRRRARLFSAEEPFRSQLPLGPS